MEKKIKTTTSSSKRQALFDLLPSSVLGHAFGWLDGKSLARILSCCQAGGASISAERLELLWKRALDREFDGDADNCGGNETFRARFAYRARLEHNWAAGKCSQRTCAQKLGDNGLPRVVYKSTLFLAGLGCVASYDLCTDKSSSFDIKDDRVPRAEIGGMFIFHHNSVPYLVTNTYAVPGAPNTAADPDMAAEAPKV